jgi:hypothetical protein
VTPTNTLSMTIFVWDHKRLVAPLPVRRSPIYHFRWDSAGRGKAGEDRDCTGALARECCVSRRAGASPCMAASYKCTGGQRFVPGRRLQL